MKKYITFIIYIIVIIGVFCLINIFVKKANKDSAEYGSYYANQVLTGNEPIDNIKLVVKKKYEATLPMNSTKGLECAIYDSNTEQLYLKYEYGICVIDNKENIERYVNGDPECVNVNKLIQNAKNNSNENTTYITSEEFNKIIK